MYNDAMNHPLLNVPTEFPSDDVLARYLGTRISSWFAFTALLKKDYPLTVVEWSYFNDGKSWLCKVAQKSKTYCWVSVWDKYFKVGFYFTAKAEDLISKSALDPALKNSFLNPSTKGKLRPLTLYVRKKADLAPVKELLAIKLKMN
jgi:hypothetical protein